MVEIKNAPPLGDKEELLVWLAKNDMRLVKSPSTDQSHEYILKRQKKEHGKRGASFFGDEVAKIFGIAIESEKKELNRRIKSKRKKLNLEE